MGGQRRTYLAQGGFSGSINLLGAKGRRRESRTMRKKAEERKEKKLDYAGRRVLTRSETTVRLNKFLHEPRGNNIYKNDVRRRRIGQRGERHGPYGRPRRPNYGQVTPVSGVERLGENLG